MTSRSISITFGCMSPKEIYRSDSRETISLARHETWQERLSVPEKGTVRTNLTCPVCHATFQVKVYSRSKARLRKFYFASCFFVIAAGGIVFGVFAGWKKGFIGYTLAAPFGIFTLWQLSNAIRQRFDPSDLVCHGGGKVHRIFDDHKITFPDQTT